MPTALVLTLRPQRAAAVAPHLGRESQAALLHTLASEHAQLARRLRQDTRLRPFTVSDLLGTPWRPGPRAVTPSQSYSLRWCGLSPELEERLRAWAAAPPRSLSLDGVMFSVEQATIDAGSHGWAGAESWSALGGLAGAARDEPPARFGVHFVAPATFRSHGHTMPLPLPELVFGSLLDRWNRYAPAPLPADVRSFVAEHLMLGRYQLQSHRVLVHHATSGSGETAFTGTCTFVATSRDQQYLQYCAALLRLAFWSGIGAKTSLGLGLVRAELDRGQRDGRPTRARAG